MVLSTSCKLNIILKLDEIYDIDPLYRASKKEINQDFKLEVNGKIFNIVGINLNKNVLSNTLGDLYRDNLIGRARNGDRNMHVKARYLYFILPQGREIATQFWNTLRKSYPRMF